MGINFILKADVWTCSMNLLVACTSLYNLTSLSTRDLKSLGSQIPLGNCGKLKTLSFPLYDLYPKVHLSTWALNVTCNSRWFTDFVLEYFILVIFNWSDVVLPGTFNDVWRYFWLSQFEKALLESRGKGWYLIVYCYSPPEPSTFLLKCPQWQGALGLPCPAQWSRASVAPELLQCGWTEWRCAVSVKDTPESPELHVRM